MSYDSIKYVFFDIFGTLANWQDKIVSTLSNLSDQSTIDRYFAQEPRLQPLRRPNGDNRASESEDDSWIDFAREWRQAFMKISQSGRGRPKGGMDGTNREALDSILSFKYNEIADSFTDDHKKILIEAWHELPVWNDAVKGLEMLRSKYFVSTLTNGDFAIMLSISKYAGLEWDAQICGDMFNSYKPDRVFYDSAIRLAGVWPEECAMVACHSWDLNAARAHGMRTFYISRPTDDVKANIDAEKARDLGYEEFISWTNQPSGGLVELAKRFGCK